MIPVAPDQLQADPDHRAALLGRVNIALTNGNPEQALDLCDHALKARPDDQDFHAHKATALLRVGRQIDAAALLQSQLDKAPGTPRWQLQLARTLFACGDYSAAETQYLAVLDHNPSQREALLGRVDIALAQADPKAALARSEDALAQEPDDQAVLRKHALALRRAGRPDDSIEVLKRLLASTPGDPSLDSELARAQREAGNLDAADAMFARALQADPDHRAALLGRVNIAKDRGEIEAAIKLLERNMDCSREGRTKKGGPINPDYTPAKLLLNLELYSMIGKFGEIKALLPQLQSALKGFSEADLMRVARLAERNEEFDLAARALHLAASRQVLSLTTANYLIRLSHSVGVDQITDLLVNTLRPKIRHMQRREFDIQVAIIRFGPEQAFRTAQASKGTPRTTREMVQLAQILLDVGEGSLAYRYLRRCLRLLPDTLSLRNLFLTACLHIGHPEAGWVYLDDLDHKSPTQDTVQQRIRLSIATGDLTKAQRLLQENKSVQKKVPVQDRIQLFLTLGLLDEAEALSPEFARTHGRSGKASAHFSITLFGAMLNELRLYRRVSEKVVPESSDSAMEKDFCRTFTYPAIQILNNWNSAQRKAPPMHTSTTDGIPRRIFQYWDKPNIPKEISAVMSSWLGHSGYQYTRLDRQGAIKYLREKFHPSFVRAFHLANNPAEECDFLRLCIMWADGGIYADADDKLISNPDSLIAEGSGVILFQEHFGAIANNLIAARPEHPLIWVAVNLAHDSLLARANDTTWSKTGPGLMTRATAVYITETPAGEVAKNLKVLPEFRMRHHVHPHFKLPYKSTPKYWNAINGAVPPPIQEVLARLTA